MLVAKAGEVVPKDHLIQAVWGDVAVSDNSLEQAISILRRTLDPDGGQRYIETHARRGYRFAAPVSRLETRETDETLDALLAPHRAWLEGRAALETLDREEIVRARQVFEGLHSVAPAQAPVHVGLANACVMQFEMTRADAIPDLAALEKAEYHARDACRLAPEYAEAWATLGFVLPRAGRRLDGLAAARRAVTLEPDNWRHHLRLSYTSWGEERLRQARQTLVLLPDFPIAHWLAATVLIARGSVGEAERELEAALSFADTQAGGARRFTAVALHWLLGLTYLARGETTRARSEFERELAGDPRHLYARECRANTWYAIGTLHVHEGRSPEARVAFCRALDEVARHPMARIGLAALEKPGQASGDSPNPASFESFEAAMCRSAELVVDGRDVESADLLAQALARAPEGDAGWLLPVEPLFRVYRKSAAWTAPLARLRVRAA